jgi:hypothetical protein
MRISWRSMRNWLRTNRESIKSWSETWKNCVEIIGIVIAAIWTYQMFVKKEAPSLEARALATSNLNLENRNAEWCAAYFSVELENTGVTSFEIRRVVTRVWKLERNQLEGTVATFLDPNEIMTKGERIFKDEHTSAEIESDPSKLVPFIRRYRPGDKFNHSFYALVKKEPHRLLFFLTEFYIEDGRRQWYTGNWSSMCEGSSNEKQ